MNKAILWDLDGTLLYTLQDLTNATNATSYTSNTTNNTTTPCYR